VTLFTKPDLGASSTMLDIKSINGIRPLAIGIRAKESGRKKCNLISQKLGTHFATVALWWLRPIIVGFHHIHADKALVQMQLASQYLLVAFRSETKLTS
jgi:hypothetical protein